MILTKLTTLNRLTQSGVNKLQIFFYLPEQAHM